VTDSGNVVPSTQASSIIGTQWPSSAASGAGGTPPESAIDIDEVMVADGEAITQDEEL
jgi:hypothetical protein